MSVQGVNEEELQVYLNSKGGRYFKMQLDNLLNTNQLSPEIAADLLRKKADEHYRFFYNPNNVWVDVKMFLEEWPEIFDITKLFLTAQPTIQFIMVVNSACCSEIEKIFVFKEVVYQREDRFLKDKTVSFYTVFQPIMKEIWYYEPFGDVFNIVEQSGFRVGTYFYTNKKDYFGIALIRGFPMDDSDKYYGDYSRAAGGLREDLGLGFKSSWEANFARILNLLALEWEYEKHSFALDTRAYFPDFKVFINDNMYYWVEIKGMWDSQSLKKVWTFKDRFREEQMLIIDSDLYMLLEEKYAGIVANWEYSNKARSSHIVPVIGIVFGNRLETINNMKIGQKVKLFREQNNAHDPNAIKVLTTDDHEVGYIAKEWASIYAFKMDTGLEFSATLEKKRIDKKRLEIKISMFDPVGEVLAHFGL